MFLRRDGSSYVPKVPNMLGTPSIHSTRSVEEITIQERGCGRVGHCICTLADGTDQLKRQPPEHRFCPTAQNQHMRQQTSAPTSQPLTCGQATYGVSAPGSSIGTLGPLGGGGSLGSMGSPGPEAIADVAPTATAAISAKIMHVEIFGIVGMCMSPKANLIENC